MEKQIDIYAPKPTEVEVDPVLQKGTEIGSITVDGNKKTLYAPDETNVQVTPAVTEGTKIADIAVDGETKELYAPTPEPKTQVEVTQTVDSGTEIAKVTVDGNETPIYAPEIGKHVESITNNQNSNYDNITIKDSDGSDQKISIYTGDVVTSIRGSILPYSSASHRIANLVGLVYKTYSRSRGLFNTRLTLLSCFAPYTQSMKGVEVVSHASDEGKQFLLNIHYKLTVDNVDQTDGYCPDDIKILVPIMSDFSIYDGYAGITLVHYSELVWASIDSHNRQEVPCIVVFNLVYNYGFELKYFIIGPGGVENYDSIDSLAVYLKPENITATIENVV